MNTDWSLETWLKTGPRKKKKATKALRFGSFLPDISFGSHGFGQNYECTRGAPSDVRGYLNIQTGVGGAEKGNLAWAYVPSSRPPVGCKLMWPSSGTGSPEAAGYKEQSNPLMLIYQIIHIPQSGIEISSPQKCLFYTSVKTPIKI